MKIGSSNNLPINLASFFVAADIDVTQEDDNLLTGDFSTVYNSAGISATFRVIATWTGPNAIKVGYFAIAGHNFGDIGGTLKVTAVGGVVLGEITYIKGDPNSVVMFTDFTPGNTTSLDIVFTKATSSDRVTVTYISAGEILPLGSQNSEQSGYGRVWLTDSAKVRATLNPSAQPVAYVRQAMSRKVSLTMSNIGIAITNSVEWRQLLDRVFKNGDFFVKEEDGSASGIPDNPLSSYMAFNADVVPPKVHSATNQLNAITIKFEALTGH